MLYIRRLEDRLYRVILKVEENKRGFFGHPIFRRPSPLLLFRFFTRNHSCFYSIKAYKCEVPMFILL